jgi:DNA invertase Pin-like site-specific DNA recombinase
MKKAALYARIASPAGQIDDQLLAIREMAAERGLEAVEYMDIAVGTKARRPGLDTLMRDARIRKFDVVIVAGFDRVARSTKHFLQLVAELGDLGIEFVAQQENISTTGDLGRQFLAITRSLLKLQADLNKELIRAGMRRRKLEGFKLGRPPLAAVNHEALVRDRLNGMSLTAVARKYQVSRGSVVRWTREFQRWDIAVVGGFSVGHEEVAVVECVA